MYLYITTQQNTVSSVIRGAAYWIWEHCVPHTEIKQRRWHGRWFCKEGSNKNSPCFPESKLRLLSRKEVMSRGRRDSLSLPGLFQSTARYSHEYCFSLAKNLCTTINTYSFTYICNTLSFLFSASSRSANWLHSLLLDTEQLDKFKTCTLIS